MLGYLVVVVVVIVKVIYDELSTTQRADFLSASHDVVYLATLQLDF